VQVRYVARPDELRAPDLVIVPGSKATIPDLLWLEASGLAQRLCWLAHHGTPVLGICGGYQMLGDSVRDPLRSESDQVEAPGLGLLPLRTELGADKRLAHARGWFGSGLPGVWSALAEAPVDGYEIHVGQTSGAIDQPLLRLEGGAVDGAVARDGCVAGTYLHGLLERAEPRHALVAALAAGRGFGWRAGPPPAEPYERLADLLEVSLRLDRVRVPCAAGERSA
jgi:adenosylcobyric acid synthase